MRWVAGTSKRPRGSRGRAEPAHRGAACRGQLVPPSTPVSRRRYSAEDCARDSTDAPVPLKCLAKLTQAARRAQRRRCRVRRRRGPPRGVLTPDPMSAVCRRVRRVCLACVAGDSASRTTLDRVCTPREVEDGASAHARAADRTSRSRIRSPHGRAPFLAPH